MAKNIDKLIINSPHQEPQSHWFYNRENRDFHIKEGRRPAGYVIPEMND
jgi:type III restriction enzyme